MIEKFLRWKNLLRSLSGDRKILLAGNHDAHLLKEYSRIFNAVLPDGMPLRVRWRGREARCVHSPEFMFEEICPGFEDLPSGYGEGRIEGEWICGHVQSIFRKLAPVVKIGVDAWDFYPVNVSDIFSLLDDPRIGIPGRKGFDGDLEGAERHVPVHPENSLRPCTFPFSDVIFLPFFFFRMPDFIFHVPPRKDEFIPVQSRALKGA